MASLPYSLEERRDGVVGLAFAMRQVAQLLLMCDRQDIGISIGAGDEGPAVGPPSPAASARQAGLTLQDLDEPRVFVYDSYPGGIGFSEPLFAMHDELVARTRELIAGCGCDHGCPTCVGPVGETGPEAKPVALLILDRLTGRRA
jgi:DEAD/DEAH box helicase domain-containing protein